MVDRPAVRGDAAGGPDRGADLADPAGGAGVPAREISRDEAFLAAAFTAGTARVRAAPIGDPARTLAEGTVLSATLETALDTSLPGPARALLARDVRSWDGSAVLLPAGTRLIGSYDARISIAQRRVAVAWTRAIRPDGIAIALGGVGADRLGRAGATGELDARLVERFGGALLVSLITAGPAAAVAALAGDRVAGDRESSGAVNTLAGDLAGDAARAAGRAARPVADDYLRLPPVIRIAPGTRLSILVTRDLAFPSGVRGVRPLRPLAGTAPFAGAAPPAPVAGAAPLVPPASLAEDALAPVRDLLTDPEVIEVALTAGGGVFVERQGHALMRAVPRPLRPGVLERLGPALAGAAGTTLGRARPLAGGRATLFGEDMRIQIAAPPAIHSGLAVSIRRTPVHRRGLDGFDMTAAPGAAPPDPRAKVLAMVARGAVAGALQQAVRDRLTLLVSGGTSSGKTTLARALLDCVGDAERMITIEDAAELRLAHPNRVELIADPRDGSGRTPADLLRAALRMRPDRVILGELRGAEALDFLEAVNTGHPGSVATLHANSPAQACERLALMALRAGAGLSRTELLAQIAATVDLVIHVARTGARRAITAIRAPTGAGVTAGAGEDQDRKDTGIGTTDCAPARNGHRTFDPGGGAE